MAHRGKDAPTTPARARPTRLANLHRRVRVAVVLALGTAATLAAAEPAWLHAKALLAQQLLHAAWNRSLARGEPSAPWPWADTHPVARLQVPALGIDQIVLAGDAGRTLAFGPGWAEASAAPGTRGTVVVSGHRDTHFAFLRDLPDGQQLVLDAGARPRSYRVVSREIVDTRDTRIALGGSDDRLLLVTCWPFDTLEAGGPLRFVVTAVAAP